MQSNSLRLILDTNLWINFLITKNYSKLEYILFSKRCVLLFSNELLTEFLTVSKRPKFRNYFSQKEIENILNTIEEYGEFVEVVKKINLCRDFKDNFLLSLSVDGSADYLLTGDKDLLELKKMDKTRIISISEFLSKKL